MAPAAVAASPRRGRLIVGTGLVLYGRLVESLRWSAKVSQFCRVGMEIWFAEAILLCAA